VASLVAREHLSDVTLEDLNALPFFVGKSREPRLQQLSAVYGLAVLIEHPEAGRLNQGTHLHDRALSPAILESNVSTQKSNDPPILAIPTHPRADLEPRRAPHAASLRDDKNTSVESSRAKFKSNAKS